VKQFYTVTHCENCDAPITLTSPPAEERYEAAEIHIEHGDILLPAAVVKSNHKEGFCDSHTADIAGYYCNLHCLAERIAKILEPSCPK